MLLEKNSARLLDVQWDDWKVVSLEMTLVDLTGEEMVAALEQYLANATVEQTVVH